MIAFIKKRFVMRGQRITMSVRFFAGFMLPIAIVVSYIIFSLICYTNYLNATYVKAAKTNLENAFAINELSINSIIDSVALLESQPSVMRFLYRTSQEDIKNNREITKAMSELTKFQGKHPIIDNISIINREEEFVITPNGKYDFTSYFFEIYSYQRLKLDFWKYLKPFDYDSYQIQTTTKVSDRNNEKTIIPIIFSRIGGTQISDLLVIDISVSALLKSMATDDDEIFDVFMLNKLTGELFSDYEGMERIKGELLDKIVLNSRLDLIHIENLDKVMYITYSPSESILSYCYFIKLSYSDLRMRLLNDTKVIILSGVVIVVLAFLISYCNTKKIAVPVEKISRLFNSAGITISKNWKFMESVKCVIERLVSENKRMDTELRNYTPIIKEKYLTSLLESNEYYYRHLIESFADKAPFKHDYYAAVIVQLLPTTSFFDKYKDVEYKDVQAKFYDLVKLQFDQVFATYAFSNQKDTLSILLNLEYGDATASIKETMCEIEELLANDRDDILLYFGSSGVYAGLDGLKEAYNQAQKSIKQSSFLKKESKSSDRGNVCKDYSIKLSEEKSIATLLTNGNTEEARKIIYTAIDRAKDNGAPLEQTQQLYAQIFSIIFDIIDKKSIPLSNDGAKNFWERINEIKTLTPANIYKTIAHYLQIIETNKTQKNSNKNIDEIMDYLKEHYSRELGLEMVADEFQMSPNYLSKLLKMRSGMLFQEYLSNLRIEKAKVLLSTTNKSITDILTEIGFNNRTTFLRAFKRNTGITPSEFRKTNEV